jgi:uncharacterized protein
MASDLGYSVVDLMRSEDLRKKIDLKRYMTDKVGLPTLNDIMAELSKPGRDPREQFEAFHFAEGVEKIEDVRPGMRLPGLVTNITAFGVFVDLGVHQDGLIHISELSDRYVKSPAEVVKVHQRVMVTVLKVDLERKRIALSMKGGGAPVARKPKPPERKPGPPEKRREREEKKVRMPERFTNNPFAEALRGKR